MRTIDTKQLKSMLDEGVYLLDVRGPDETAQGIIDGAKRLPLHLVPLHLDKLPKGETLYIYCRSGNRSGQACAYLDQHGFDTVNVAGGIMQWVAQGDSLVAETGATLAQG